MVISQMSFSKKCEILTTLKKYMKECLFVDQEFRKHQSILGPPGTGKMYVLTIALGYALSKGLSCLVTSLGSGRSIQLGGEHIYNVFCLPLSSNGSPLKMAEQALNKLDFRSDKKVLLLAVEVLFVEEVGLISAEQWCAMDIIHQDLRQSNLPFAGNSVIASGDQMQLRAIDGNDIFLSPVLLTNFDLFFLSNLVRMTDEAGAKVLREMWRRPIEAGGVQEILRILGEKRTFKDSRNDLTIHQLCAFPENGKWNRNNSRVTFSKHGAPETSSNSLKPQIKFGSQKLQFGMRQVQHRFLAT